MTDLTKDQVAELAGYPSYVELLEADRATLLGLYEKSVHERVELKRELEYLRTQTAPPVKALAEAAIRDCASGAPISAANLARDILSALSGEAQR